MTAGGPPRTKMLTLGVLLLCLISLWPLLAWSWNVVPFPYGVDYGEGIIWKQMNEIVAGRAYGTIDQFPAIVYHYPPLFHWFAAAVAGLGLDPLLAGRLVSVVATLGAGALVGAIALQLLGRDKSGAVAIVAAACGAACFFAFDAVRWWAPVMRVDPLACCLALAGLWCAIAATRSADRGHALAYAAGALFALSVLTKQISLPAPAAAFCVLVFRHPGLAWRILAASLVVGGVIFGALLVQTDGAIVSHLFLYNVNRFDLARLLPNFQDATRTPDLALMLAGVAGLGAALWHRRRGPAPEKAADSALMIAAAYLALNTASLIATAKYGSSSAYYLQWMSSLAVFAGYGAGRLAARHVNGADRAAGIALIAAVASVAVLATALAPRNWRHLPALRQQEEAIAEILRPVTKPVIAADMALLMRTGRDVVWEPAIFTELSRVGVWDERLILSRIDAGDVGAVVSDGERGDRWFDEHFNPAVADAIDARLPVKVRIGSRVVHLPRTLAPR